MRIRVRVWVKLSMISALDKAWTGGKNCIGRRRIAASPGDASAGCRWCGEFMGLGNSLCFLGSFHCLRSLGYIWVLRRQYCEWEFLGAVNSKEPHPCLSSSTGDYTGRYLVSLDLPGGTISESSLVCVGWGVRVCAHAWVGEW